MAVVETEIKFQVEDSAALERKLESLGFRLLTPSSFESNMLYDTPGRDLRLRRELVRIRHYTGRWVLTHKRMSGSDSDDVRHKHRIETETEVSDGDALASVLTSVGLVPVFCYEKWRAEWADSEGHCVVDETPLGSFAELEGPEEWIDRVAEQLGVEPEQRLTLSYGRLFEKWKARTGSDAQNLTFAEVRGEAAPSATTA